MKQLLPLAISSVLLTVPAHAALTTSLAAYWDFEGDAKNANVASGGSAYDGVLSGNATTVTGTTLVGTGALRLDGAGDYMTVGALVDLNQSWTISAWFNSAIVPTGSGDANRHFVYESYNSSSTNTGYGMSFGLRDGTTGNTNFQTFTDLTPGSDLSRDVQIADGSAADTWYHIAETYDSTTKTVTIYLNGVSQGTLSLGTNTFVSADALRLGTYRLASTRYFNGSIDEVAIWNRALSASEINNANTGIAADSLYQRGLAGMPVPEPASTLLGGIGMLALLRRRSR